MQNPKPSLLRPWIKMRLVERYITTNFGVDHFLFILYIVTTYAD